ncbi:hypothetical protein MG296_07340 [Flavobacteriaceae bacterium TK19130]|nr:hypothetical protein [Thermobacterium salinum]
MSFSIIYKKLCDVNLYHEYFLNDGVTSFDDSPTLKEQQLSKYDFREFMGVMPSEDTHTLLNGYRIIFKPTEKGFTLLMQVEEAAPNSGNFTPKIALEPDTKLEFLLYINDFIFENYSTVSAIPHKPFYFSNKKPASEGNSFKYIDLETTKTPISDYTISQTTWDALKVGFTEKERLSLFGIISLEMQGDDTTGYDGNTRNILSNGNPPLLSPKNFKLHFHNRSTVWHYKNALDNTLVHSTDPTELPLVKNGIVGYTFNSEPLPAADPTRIIFEKDGNGNIIKTISEIYIN